MRDNTRSLISLPEYSTATGLDGLPYSLIRAASVQHGHTLAKTYGRTENEKRCSWHRPDFIGLKGQTIEDFDTSMRARYPQECLERAMAKINQKPSRPGSLTMAVTGGFWDTPSVIAGLPLAARSRSRSKLPPKDIRIFLAFSGSVSSETMAPITAKIAKAIWDYKTAGGAVTLTILTGSKITGQHNRAVIETRVNVSDVASLAVALSPVYMRSISAALLCALSDKPGDTLPMLRDQITPNVFFLSDIGASIVKAADKVVAQLEII